MSRRASRLWVNSTAVLVAFLLLLAWGLPKWIARSRAMSQLQKDGFLYADHGLIPDYRRPKDLTISPETAAAIALLQPRDVIVKGSSTITNLDFLAPLKSVKLLEFEYCPQMNNVGGIRNLASVEMLILSDCSSIHSMDVFSRLRSLRMLSL